MWRRVGVYSSQSHSCDIRHNEIVRRAAEQSSSKWLLTRKLNSMPCVFVDQPDEQGLGPCTAASRRTSATGSGAIPQGLQDSSVRRLFCRQIPRCRHASGQSSLQGRLLQGDQPARPRMEAIVHRFGLYCAGLSHGSAQADLMRGQKRMSRRGDSCNAMCGPLPGPVPC